jgi:hypothetical protein
MVTGVRRTRREELYCSTRIEVKDQTGPAKYAEGRINAGADPLAGPHATARLPELTTSCGPRVVRRSSVDCRDAMTVDCGEQISRRKQYFCWLSESVL